MIVFEVTVNGKTISTGLDKGVFSVIISRVINEIKDNITLDVRGMGSDDQENIEWVVQDLQLDDLVTVRVKDLNEITEPIRVKRNESEKLLNESKVEFFYSLKKELEEKGLI